MSSFHLIVLESAEHSLLDRIHTTPLGPRKSCITLHISQDLPGDWTECSLPESGNLNRLESGKLQQANVTMSDEIVVVYAQTDPVAIRHIPRNKVERTRFHVHGPIHLETLQSFSELPADRFRPRQTDQGMFHCALVPELRG